jgi:hypothetical protein
VVYNRGACEAAGEDALLELVDWSHRKLLYLNSHGHQDAAAAGKGASSVTAAGRSGQRALRAAFSAAPLAHWRARANPPRAPGRTPQQLLAATPEEEFDQRCSEVAWGAAMCGLTITRYLAEHAAALPLGVMARMVGPHDMVAALLSLVDSPPWVLAQIGQVSHRSRRPACLHGRRD